jgi:diguanylate cyclase (GGDEF)-like protein
MHLKPPQQIFSSLTGRVSKWFSIYSVEETTAAYFRAEQVRAIIALAPLSISANLINITVILYLFSFQTNPWLYLWGFAILVLMAIGLRGWFNQQKGKAPVKSSRRALKKALRHSAVVGFLWGLLPLLTMGQANTFQLEIILIVLVGMICASSFALSTVPAAAFCFVILVSAETILALLIFQPVYFKLLILLFAIYSYVVCAAVLVQAKNFGARLMAEAASNHQQQLTSLLLHDFETHTSDCLWELNQQGYLQNPSAKLANLFGLSLNQLNSIPFIKLFGTHPGDEQLESTLAMDALKEHFAQQKSFRHLSVPLSVNDIPRWWQLTAKPLMDTQGNLLGWRGVGTDVTKEREANRVMNRLANVDSLTGLANRHQFQSRLDLQENSNNPTDKFYVLLLLDLDNFKMLNDGMGHAFGDKVLQLVASQLKQQIRQHDLLARLGGDEFALISWGEDATKRADVIAQRLLDCFSQTYEIDGMNMQISCSIGIAISPLHCDSADTLLKHADMALYAAKSAGKNTFRFYESGMAAAAQKRMSLLNDIRQVLEQNPDTKSLFTKIEKNFHWATNMRLPQFQIYLQPQIHLKTKEIIGFEALMRWQHPEKGMIPPMEFIPLAEESNMIIPLGAWMLIESCKLAAKWPQPWRIAVNVSATQFSHGSLIPVVKRALDISGITPDRLELEITESLLIQDKNTAKVILQELRNLGVRIALDDFGTGYSSLAYLRNFPLNQLKIDRSFVSAILREKGSLAIVNTIIQLADALSLETIAEGIESAKEVHLLIACGCEDGQGFHFAKPMPSDQLQEFVSQYPYH